MRRSYFGAAWCTTRLNPHVTANGVGRFADVEVVEDAGSALLCSVGCRCAWVPVMEIRYGTKVGTGDRGNLVIPRLLAQQIGLVTADVTRPPSE
jgi:hypothetical protein